MAAKLTYPHIEVPAGATARLARLPRIRVAQIVMDHLGHGWSAEEICRQHPGLHPAEVHAALAYYFDNPPEIEEEIERETEKVQAEREQRPRSPFVLRLLSRRQQ